MLRVLSLVLFALFSVPALAADVSPWPVDESGCTVLARNMQIVAGAFEAFKGKSRAEQQSLWEKIEKHHDDLMDECKTSGGKCIFPDAEASRPLVHALLRAVQGAIYSGKMDADSVGWSVYGACASHIPKSTLPPGITPKGPQIKS
jgi:hypothetical protein